MNIISVKTHKIISSEEDLLTILDKYLPRLKEKSVLAITSKIVSICEGSVIKIGKMDKTELIKKQADYFISPEQSKYNITLTIKRGMLVPTAGIDESNGNGYYILWPKNPQKTANIVRKYLKKKFQLKFVGVIITDSKTTPLRWGTTGFALAHSGFNALNNYIGKPDIFGRLLHVSKASVMDALASSAVAVMGEGNEQTPLATIEDVPFVKFQSRNPTKNELNELNILFEDDLYAPLLKSINWKKGIN
ncbi:hypothetical protein A2954_05655 [Candidatus Roizmanbacteria bacterium RIFCSPLOWO2_01_FULL_37_12]|uniref:Coenzyme F420:L-glutamate ligase-like domain-containing protein n=1 Tax=Candidatus Roizmanbacteria bacterium RIFCSPLOWO2_01_FULL_37_12 TaxID=1802056 RepID=A0A1F7IBQ4_9BACT|nr:MAG: hypothetical protein A2768_02395 [Candidatus Roizmanbacteria bacterium RIFCSPHIGHO2_01_FULL_37_16]OGK24923.1 MAG: hypothetical protein A3D76_02830 [Candidatus Roizmanbacteria bacterium RIFCSPHIGHO2_02_FULL_37_9b]OGK40794.1 MAG: hypothetical protein A2954_05655 [Candidatus Roizmanbacteria bacterium RIFCSPLOWO2_01_FULL_37_12]